MLIAVLLFKDYETLDVFGPVEVFGQPNNRYTIKFYSLNGGQIQNKHGVSVFTSRLNTIDEEIEIFIIPGGIGTRLEVNNSELIDAIKQIAHISKYVFTVCTGSALLAQTGLLNGKHATSNKKAFVWASSFGNNIRWNKQARWVVDGKYYTSSGVSAGIDMALGFIKDRYGLNEAQKIASNIEYHWINDSNNDSFSA
jgi:putative intracellular protease/amidase